MYFAHDADLDRLVDRDDTLLGTNPNNADTDGDGMPDGWEVRYFGCFDPLTNDASGDCDRISATNLTDYNNGTDPTVADTDGDGLPHGWEISNGLNPLRNDAIGNPDGNNLTNLQEYQQGKDPKDYDHGTLPNLSIVSGNNQVGVTNRFLAQPLSVSVTNAVQGARGSAPVTFAVIVGGAPLTTLTNGSLNSPLALRTASSARRRCAARG